MSSQVVEGRELELIDECEGLEKIKEYLSSNPPDEGKLKVLGLHRVGEDVKLGNCIGVVWIGADDGRVALRVDSKFAEPTMDYMEMFSECCIDIHVGENMQGCFEVWPKEELIEIPDAAPFSFMIIAAFLRGLNTLCARHLRRHIHPKRENFTGKVKGKIIVSENLRRNIGHAERMFCGYQAISDDILENRILRAALEKAARYLSAQNESTEYEVLQRWVHACRAHLRGVSVAPIVRRDFDKVRYRGAFALYRRPLDLAKAVLYYFGFNPQAESEKKTKTPPYYINSPVLFERYAELHLRNDYENIVSSGLSQIYSGTTGIDIPASPDFYVPRQEDKNPIIIDAKYKPLGKRPDRSDVNQMVTYSQHIGILHEINASIVDKRKADDVELHLVYPWLEGMLRWPDPNVINSFKARIRIIRISCPVVPPASQTTEDSE